MGGPPVEILMMRAIVSCLPWEARQDSGTLVARWARRMAGEITSDGITCVYEGKGLQTK